MLLYLYDRDILDYRNETKDIKFFLNILKNDLNINEKDFFKLILTLSALGEPIPDEMWNIFFSNEIYLQNPLNLSEMILVVILC